MLARSLLRRGCSLRGRRCASRKALDAEARAATVDVTLATHSARGVTGKDAALADFMDYAHAGRRGAGPR